jgi:hypothetical protein
MDDCETRFAIHARSTVGRHDAPAENRVAEHTNGGGG